MRSADSGRKNNTGHGDREAYLKLGLEVLLMSIREEGVGYLSDKDGSWWIEVLDVMPDDVLKLLQSPQVSEPGYDYDWAVAI